MRANLQTNEFLNLLLWSGDLLARPTFRNLTDSYECWAYRRGLLQRLSRLEQQQIIERGDPTPDARMYRLTTQGRLQALGGRDPEQRWARVWDGQWRLVLWDVPMDRNAQREKLRRRLRNRGFGWLQNSVWITPDPLTEEAELLRDAKPNVESLLLLEARPCAGETDAEIVAGAWDFARINRRYEQYAKVLEQRPLGNLHDETTAKAFQRWAAAEREAWINAVTHDPLLPARLLPTGYLGQDIWRRRHAALGEAGQQIRSFTAAQV